MDPCWRCSWLVSIVLGLVVFWSGAGCGGAMPEPSPWIYRALQTDEGLPDNRVTGVVQTDDGFLWVATRGGLLRFNGSEFMAMPLPSLPEIHNRVVMQILLDRSGRIWLWMEQSLLVCLGPDGVQTFGRKDGMPGGQISSMAEDGEGAVWLAFSGSLCRVKDGRCTIFGNEAGFLGGPSWVAADARKQLWYAHENRIGVVRQGALQDMASFDQGPVRMCRAASGLWISAGNRLLKQEEGREPEELGRLPDKVEVSSLLEDQAGGLWVGTVADGLFRLLDGTVEQVPTSHQEVSFLSEDREGNIWASTQGGGLNLIFPRTVELTGRGGGLLTESFASVCEDAEGALWVAGHDGRLARKHHGLWTEIDSSSGWNGRRATCLAADGQGGVWVGCRDRGVHYWKDGKWRSWSKSSGLASNSARSMRIAANGDVWVAMEKPRLVQRFRDGEWSALVPPRPIRPIRAMAEGADGTIWLGTSTGELFRASETTLVPEALGAGHDAPKESMSIRTLHTTPDGALWIGYAGFGLGRLKDGKYARISIEQGLADEYPSQIVTDGGGAMWIVGNQGLFQVPLSELEDVAEGRAKRVRSRVFGRSHGLVGLQSSFDRAPSVLLARDGRLIFATRSGLLFVRPFRLRDNPQPPPVVLERVSVDEVAVARYDNHLSLANDAPNLLDLHAPAAPLRLLPGHRKLEFQFAALSYASPENVHCRYRLEGFDKEWIEAGPRQSASYPQLPAGQYEFRVIACNNAGVWNETGAALAFAVSPFFWQTWWFRSSVLSLFTAGIIALVRYLSFRRLREKMRHLKQQAALEKERSRIARDMHDEVGAKLTRLSLLSDMASAQAGLSPAAQSDVREISETARETILAFEEIVWAVNPRNDTLGDLVHYVCRHAEEFFEGSDTQCVFDLPKSIPPLILPTEVRHQLFLASKEALNNVMKHSGATQVTVRLVLGPGSFDLKIHDDGCGLDLSVPSKRAGGGNGLTNMRERIRGIGGRFTCENPPEGGGQISFHVPLPESKS